ncbi:hypothetical protein F2Q68_00003986 [Brassica cretica]|uniref:Uncharacterized protein n=1 Tax=Brassica cretica TaxID=69181 RepID=A0A8S9JL96_BRACR|nr:hypothetical protein F2Q68_00003986 [Brassica cretica]
MRDVALNASFVSLFLRAGYGPRSPWSLHFLKVVDERLSSERVPHPTARSRSEYQLHFFFLRAGCGPADLAPSWSLPFSRDVNGVLVRSGCRTPPQEVTLPSFRLDRVS